MNKALLLLLFSFLSFCQLRGQSTETFENVLTTDTSFTRDGYTFNIISKAPVIFDVYFLSNGGWNGTAKDHKFIDNSGSTYFNTPVEFAISSNTAFVLKSFYLYLAQSNISLNVSGTLTITGKLKGVEKFTAIANSPFNTSNSINNGYTFINFANFGGANNSNVSIDEVIIKTSGNIAYVALDAFTWDSSPCEVPANITSSGIVSDKATISWTNTGTFDLEWGAKGFTRGSGLGTKNGLSAISHTITGLSPETEYDVYIRQNCTTKQSDWVKYTFQTRSVCPSGGVNLLSQANVDNFGAMYPNCTQINGSLSIQGQDITDLTPLNKIEHVKGYLRVNYSDSLINLDGLSSLTQLDDFIDIYNNKSLNDISGLKNVNTLNLWLIESNPTLSVCNIASVCRLIGDSQYLYIENNAAGCNNITEVRATCTPACEVPANITSSGIVSDKATINWTNTGTFDLEWGAKGFTQGSGLGTKNGLSAISHTITGLSPETEYDVYIRQNCTTKQSDWVKYTFRTISVCPSGGVNLLSQANVDNFGAMYPNCTQIKGNLSIQGQDITDLTPLNKIEYVRGYLRVNYSDSLINLDGLSSLTQIDDFIDIYNNKSLNNISGLKNVNTLSNWLIQSNPKLSVCNITSLCNILQNNPNLVSIFSNATGCKSATEVKAACSEVLSVSDIKKKEITAYPNPFTDIINLSDVDNIASVTISDISGKLIKKIVAPTKEINLNHLSEGLYIINLKMKDGKTQSIKVIKK